MKKKIENPPHWYFPISKAEMHKRRMKNIDRALKKIGMTREELEKKYKNIGKKNKKKRKKRKERKQRRGENDE